MAYSNVSIANLALGRAGVKRTIALLTESSAEAIAVNRTFTHSRGVVLDSAPWPFAMQYKTLALVDDFTSETTAQDWYYSYRYPSATVRLRRLVTVSGRVDDVGSPWELGGDATGRLVYTDEVDAIAQVTADITDPTYFTPAFADALVWRIAADIAMPLAISDTIRSQCEQAYLGALAWARAAAFNEAQHDKPGESSFMLARE